MLISFVVPAYNEQEYLPGCLQSILDDIRGLEHLCEIIVVDNASTDRTAEVAASFPGIHVVHESRRGLPCARQAGFLAASGKLIANVDSDSRLPQGWTRTVIDHFRANTALVALSGPFTYYGLSQYESVAVRAFYGLAWLTYVTNRYILKVGSMLQGGNFVVTRDAMERIGGFDLSITFYGEDTDIARRMHDVGEVLFTSELKMFSSPRRLRKEGFLRTGLRYAVNYFWTTFLKRPFSREHIDIRESNAA